MPIVERYFHPGTSYDPFVIWDGWQVAQLHYAPGHTARKIRRVDRHNRRDVEYRGLDANEYQELQKNL